MKQLKREVYNYAVASVNLYGFITLRKLASIINQYNHTEYQAKDLEEILENYLSNEECPIVKKGRIIYQKQIFEDTDIMPIYEMLKDKPYYIPESSEEFLNYYEASYYELPKEFDDLKDFYTKWTENEDMAYVMAKDVVMAFNVDCPITDIYEAYLARLNDYLNVIESPHYLNDVSRSQMITLLINLNNAVRKITLRGFRPIDVVEED